MAPTKTQSKLRKADAVKAFGNARKLALALDITPQAVNEWGDFVPPLRVYQLIVIKPELQGKVRRTRAAASSKRPRR